ncbi:AAA family ATPase [Spirulina sp. CS-785/01]|uniref:trifunctional serine/threonine-protein kinase/ATP-binding protein/sensor histidine kinase n=1 Tax=Spirulina sp. CS-785/01 TaxID=3021716 RepID=UPI00233006A3|nr:trifunctional serine/threonine-protein kinase/ATP-binding protein/sensor histidine kinase [Spirulina sp. CS-785/01]MDB9312927.1 AAA family ATPase [Spirulina sp. CS-785/01]
MLVLSDYEIHEQIHESNLSRVYRGQQLSEKRPVVLKYLKSEYPTPTELSRYRKEYEILQLLQQQGRAGIINAYHLESYQNSLILILEDFGGQSLKDWLTEQGKPYTLSDFFTVALSITDALGQIHNSNIIHKDLNPSNIVYNPQTQQLKILDFGISSILSRENPTLRNLNLLEGTLPYLSPEQTGRMNRSLDYRTDFYSLGVTFYELLTGKLPFQSRDSLELVHCHLAKTPSPLTETTQGAIPPGLSEIIQKLLAKTAENRYQSAWGLKADLQYCQRQLTETGTIAPFPLGRYDVSGKFHIPEKLYGRDEERDTLLRAFEAVAANEDGTASPLMLVSGYSGIGKSSLVQELYKPITAKRGYFISGKFDQFQRNIPYSALVHAFTSLVRQLLTEPQEILQNWRNKLLTALGNNGQIIIEVIPEIELIIGPQPPVAQLDSAEAQNRFNLVFQNFIQVFCSPEHPLVLFLDDLQWADSATLKLLELILTNADTHYLFLIGAYRDNEVSSGHSLAITLDQLKALGVNLQEITLTPLTCQDVGEMLADTFQHSPETLQDLTALITQKTGGNPFFIGEFLKTLYQENLLQFDLTDTVPQWRWDIQQIEGMEMTDNVVELMIQKLQKLSSQTWETLRLAACIGSTFDLPLLTQITQKSNQAIFADLKLAIDEGFILPLTEFEEDIIVSHYRFEHDRIQQASYELIERQDKQNLHLQIGRLLRQDTPDIETSEQLFTIVDHLDIGLDQVTDESEKLEIANLNYQAGIRAKAATAYESAVEYLEIALRLWQPEEVFGDTEYEKTLNLYIEIIEALYLNTYYTRALQLIEIALNKIKTPQDQLKIHKILIGIYTAKNELETALETGLNFLQKLGISLGEAPPENLDIETLRNLPENRDQFHLNILRLILQLVTVSIIINPSLYPRFIYSNLQLCLQYGNSIYAALTYAQYGVFIGFYQGQREKRYQLGGLALELAKRFPANAIASRIFVVCYDLINPWKRPIRETIQAIPENLNCCLENGEIEFGAYTAGNYYCYLFLAGYPLNEVLKKYQDYWPLLQKLEQPIALAYTKNWHKVVTLFHGQEETWSQFQEEFSEETEEFRHWQEQKVYSQLHHFFLAKTLLSYYLGDYEGAIINAQQTQEYELFNLHPMGSLRIPYHSLALLARYPHVSPEEQETYLKQVETNQHLQQQRVEHGPDNFQHQYALVEAEKARVLGNWPQATDWYEQAIQEAHQQQYLYEEALAYELAAQFYLSRNQEKIAQTYFREAHYLYSKWQGWAKVEDLENRYSRYLPTKTTLGGGVEKSLPLSDSSNSDSQAGEALDLATVLKASQTISQEIALDRVLRHLMIILIQNTGAQLGYLLLETEGEWFIEATGTVLESEIEVLQSRPVQEALPESLLYYVTRTQESVVLDDAREAENYNQDPYIRQNQPLSLLCTPLINQGKLSAIIYLENNLTTGAFTRDRLEVINILSAQAAISIENARLYADLEHYNHTLEQRVAERTQELSQALENLKTTQKQLVESEKMAALGGLVAGVAHEINTPIGIGVTAASVLAEKATSFFELYKTGKMKRSQLEQFLDVAMQSSSMVLGNLNRAAELIQSFKQVAVDQSSEAQRAFQLKAYLEEILIPLRPRLKRTKHTVEIYGDEELTLNTFPGVLSQIVTNLVMNSLTHAFKSEESGCMRFDFQIEENHITLKYSDNGQGIEAQHLKHIFEPFYTTKRGQGGTGLGLHLVYNLVTQKLQGTINCYSRMNEGTTFIIKLPDHLLGI